ncbi:MAG: DinB family protein [Bryobacterales bacterium]|nr:DinB family protein [Bryobacterales bacterium]
MEFSQLSSHLGALVAQAGAVLGGISPEEWRFASAPGKWSRLEIVGHLVDSACNNHQRFVRALAEPALTWPGYDQEAHVRVQRFASAEPETTLALFVAFNRHIAWLLDEFPAEKRKTPCVIGNAPAMSLEDLALDYVAHLEHHLRQITNGLGEALALRYSGMPWPPEDPGRQWPV